MNTKQQGNIGLGKAIAHFTSLQYIVSVPLNDSQGYDLIVDNGKKLLRVQVKTSRHKKKTGSYVIALRQMGGSRRTGRVKMFDKSTADIMYALCIPTGEAYLIPYSYIHTKNSLALGADVQQYLIKETKQCQKKHRTCSCLCCKTEHHRRWS